MLSFRAKLVNLLLSPKKQTLKIQNMKVKQPNLNTPVILYTMGSAKKKLTFLKSFRLSKEKNGTHNGQRFPWGVYQWDWREPWDFHQTPRANNWWLPTIKINQNMFPKTGAPEWDKWHQLILKTTLDRPNSLKSKVLLRVCAPDGWAALQALSIIVSGFIRRVRTAQTRVPGRPEGSVRLQNHSGLLLQFFQRGHCWRQWSRRTT